MSTTPRTAGFRPVDLIGIVYIVALTAALFAYTPEVGNLTKAHPALMSFIKFALLATFGECLKNRLTTGVWLPARVIIRAMVWGVFGIWIGADFVLVAAGVQGLIAKGQWSDAVGPFGLSLWLNVLSGYGFTMMFTHYWADHLIDHTVTFSLPPQFRVVCAAYLSLGLGLILSFAKRRGTAG